MKLQVSWVVLTLTVASAAPVHALEYYTHRALAFTYKTGEYTGGYAGWLACGPTQCLITGNETEEKAFGYVDGYKLGPREFIGTHGRCNVYIGGELRGTENSSDWVASQMPDKCRQ